MPLRDSFVPLPVAELVVGLGLRAGVDAAALAGVLQEVFGDEPIAVLATLDRRVTEPGLMVVARARGAVVVGYPAAELAAVAVPNPSAHTLRALGTASVAEAAALAAGVGGELVVTKRVVRGVVVAAARKV